MKAVFFKSFVLVSFLAIFAVGCGKDNSSGGGNNAYSNNYYGTPSQGTEQALKDLRQWHNSTYEGQGLIGQQFRVEKVQQDNNQSSNQNCKELDLKLFKVPYCYSTYSGGTVSSGTVVSSKILGLFQDNVVLNKKNNPELNSIIKGTAGRILQAERVINNPNAYRIDILSSNNSVTSYIIDKSYHSLLNPVVKTSVEQTGSVTIITKGCQANLSKCP